MPCFKEKLKLSFFIEITKTLFHTSRIHRQEQNQLNQMKKVVIPGGSGFLGQVLSEYYAQKDYQVIILTRNPQQHQAENIQDIYWDGKSGGEWQQALENAALLINLAGKSVNCRYHNKNKAAILNSRIQSTAILGETIQACKNPPKLWINSSSATIYIHNQGESHDEYTGITGNNFSENVCQQWEQTFDQYHTPHTRKVKLRLSIVFGRQGGALPVYVNLVKWGLGGKQATGKQYISWIHEEDFCRMIEFIEETPDIEGVINGASPFPIQNQDFMKTLRKTHKQSLGIPSLKWMLELGAIFLGTETELVLKSRKVAPAKLLEKKFDFKFPKLEATLIDLKN